MQNAEEADGGISWTLGRLLIYVGIDRLITSINRSFQTFETSYYVLSGGQKRSGIRRYP